MLFELGIFVNAALVLWIVRLLAPAAFRQCARAYRRVAQRRWLAIVGISLLALLGSISLSAMFGVPEPIVHDEYSYLLAADTFAHGRLTNPPHPLWESFETIHVNVQPTYHSMYPPGQGAVLALGQILTGYPVVGVWLSMALACGAVCWMMQAWLPACWALYGAAIATLKLVFAPYPWTSLLCPGYWSHSYWGGAVATFGGALLFGAMGRLLLPVCTAPLRRRAREGSPRIAGSAIVLALGCAILANSRPFEGLVAALFACTTLGVAMIRGHAISWRVALWQIALPVLAVLGPTGLFIAYYNEATIGKALQLPYELNTATYSTTPVMLLGQLPSEPIYRHKSIRRFYRGWVRKHLLRQQSLAGFLDVGREKLQELWTFFYSPLLILPLLAMSSTLRSKTSQFALWGCLTLVCALAHIAWLQPHYFAPMAGLVYLLPIQGARCIVVSRALRSWLGPVFAPALLFSLAVSTGVQMGEFAGVDQLHHWNLKRAAIAENLNRLGGRHLVLVSDANENGNVQDWIYNAADIDASPIVWARTSDDEQTRRLTEYYAERRAWQARVSGLHVELVPVLEPKNTAHAER